jgi:GR25 family glycosyltransferase involved in LPS biosynthesis
MNKHKFTYDVSIIRLKRIKERCNNANKIKSRFQNLNIKTSIFDAVDALKLSNPIILDYQKKGYLPLDLEYDHVCNRPFTKQHFAIWLSHVLLWEKLIEMSDPPEFHLIFEDDAEMTKDFLSLFDKWLDKTKGFKNMDLVNFYVFDFVARDFNLQKDNLYKSFIKFVGLQCYLIRHSFLKKLLELIKPMTTAVDEQLMRLKIRKYFIYDDFVTHGKIRSVNKYL